MFKPMLSPQEDPLKYPDYFRKLRYPLLLSPKIDGIRGVTKNAIMMSRKFIELPSLQVQDELTRFEHADGEIVEGNISDINVYNRTQSHVMSVSKPGRLSFNVFDYTHPDWLHKPFYKRLEMVRELLPQDARYRYVEHHHVDREDELLEYENRALEMGFEGIMMRDPVGHYKCGRGTYLQGLIYKLKRFEDGEGIIIDIYEKLNNNNVAEKDALGHTKRSHHQANKAGAGMAGGFIVSFEGQELDVAPGSFTHEELKYIWQNKHIYLNRMLKIRFMRHGMKDKPRFLRALGWRSAIDV